MRDNCTHLQIALVLSCSRAKSALGCSIHLNPSEQLQKLPPAVTPITMSTCTTFICSFFFVLKNDGLSEQQCLSIVSVFVFYQLQIHYLQQSTIMLTNTVHHRFSVFMFFPFFISICFFFRSLVRPLESVCYWAQSVKVSSCKVCEVCSVCMYVYCVFVSVSIYVYLCLCLCVYSCLFMSMYVYIYVYCKCLMCEGPQL